MTELRRVRVVGTGLLGTSVGLALSARGVAVTLVDPSPVAAALAADMGAGVVATEHDAAPDVVLVAAPPDVVAEVVVRELSTWPDAVVTDVASVKERVVESVIAAAPQLAGRYVGGHPMAGRERSGAVAARSDLFEGRTWVICSGDTPAAARDVVVELALACGGRVVLMDPVEHDRAVAAVSHVPQVAASLVAAELRGLSEEAVSLSGQGVRDVTRIAASDPLLWTQILSGNAQALLPVLADLRDRLDAVHDALSRIAAGSATHEVPGPRAVLAHIIAEGQDGQARIPGKHGQPQTTYSTVAVVIPDAPGALGRVFTLVGESGVSIEDVRIEHDDGVAAGLLELVVLPVRAERLRQALTDAGWKAHVLETH